MSGLLYLSFVVDTNLMQNRGESNRSDLRRLLSFVWPQTTFVPSRYNGTLEVTWVGGRKILDSKNANYSYGTLQRILEIALAKINLSNANSILVLGLGGGSVVDSLRNRFGYLGRITAVEIDPVVIRIAKEEFNIVPDAHFEIIEDDAYIFVTYTKETFDVVIVDLFIDDKVPPQFYSWHFCDSLKRVCAPGGQVVFNLGLSQHTVSDHEDVIDYFRNAPGFLFTIAENVAGTNVVLIAQSGFTKLKPNRI
jgi:spermidine synthase